jgi:hypothetical protein
VARCHGLIVASLAFKLKHLKSHYLTLLFEGFKHFDYLPWLEMGCMFKLWAVSYQRVTMSKALFYAMFLHLKILGM